VLRLAHAIVKLILGPFISEIGLAPADIHPPFSLCVWAKPSSTHGEQIWTERLPHNGPPGTGNIFNKPKANCQHPSQTARPLVKLLHRGLP
jgi:hypothetical protein